MENKIKRVSIIIFLLAACYYLVFSIILPLRESEEVILFAVVVLTPRFIRLLGSVLIIIGLAVKTWRELMIHGLAFFGLAEIIITGVHCIRRMVFSPADPSFLNLTGAVILGVTFILLSRLFKNGDCFDIRKRKRITGAVIGLVILRFCIVCLPPISKWIQFDYPLSAVLLNSIRSEIINVVNCILESSAVILLSWYFYYPDREEG